MNKLNAHRYDMLSRVQTFGIKHRDLFPASGFGGRMFTALGNALQQMRTYMNSEASGKSASRQNVVSKADARKALRDALDGIARTAGALSLDVPGIEGKFRMPNSTDHEMVTAAQVFLSDAAPFVATFVSHGLPARFLADLKTKIEAFENASREHTAAWEAGVTARVGIATALELAGAAIQRLDVIVPNSLRNNPTIRAAWNEARRIMRIRTIGEQTDPPAPTPTVAPSAPVPADTGRG
jgi:hypothetical protein